MARTKRDELKRNIGQAVNHQSGAILDLYEVYTQFDEAAKKVAENGPIIPSPENYIPSVSHAEMSELIKTVIQTISASRDATLKLAMQLWGLDEDGLMSYL